MPRRAASRNRMSSPFRATARNSFFFIYFARIAGYRFCIRAVYFYDEGLSVIRFVALIGD